MNDHAAVKGLQRAELARRRIEKELNLETYVCKIADLLLRNMPSRA